MAKYFEVINDDNSVVIDDNYECLELVDSFPLSQCTKVNSSFATYYRFPRVVGATLYGISVNGLNNVARFSFETTSDSIYFFGTNSAIANAGIVSVARDDIISKATLYAFNIPNRKASTNGIGLEIYNASGNVVYSSMKKYLNTLECGSDYTKTTAFNGTTIIFNLGYDRSCDYYFHHALGGSGFEYTMRPFYEIKNNTVTITRATYSVLFSDFDYNEEHYKYEEWDFEHYFEAWLGYGWLVGNVT